MQGYQAALNRPVWKKGKVRMPLKITQSPHIKSGLPILEIRLNLVEMTAFGKHAQCIAITAFRELFSCGSHNSAEFFPHDTTHKNSGSDPADQVRWISYFLLKHILFYLNRRDSQVTSRTFPATEKADLLRSAFSLIMYSALRFRSYPAALPASPSDHRTSLSPQNSFGRTHPHRYPA